MFCVHCAKETTEELRSGLCEVCFLERNQLATLPVNVDFEACVHCHARKRGELWVSGFVSLDVLVDEAVREAIGWDKRVQRPTARVEIVPEDERNFTVNVLAQGLAEGLPFEQALTTRSRLKNGTCLRCSRLQGGYYESILQVRATKRDMTQDEIKQVRQMAVRLIDRVVELGDRNAFVLRDEEIHGGIDIYMGTTNSGRVLAKQLVSELGGKAKEHAKIIGQKDGLDVVRMTFAVRLPEYRMSDYVVLSDEVLEVGAIGVKTVALTPVLTGRTRHVERPLLDKATVLSRADAREAVVVVEEGNEMQILDPWSYQTVTVLRPEGLERKGDTVEVLRWEEQLFVLRPPKGVDGA